MHDFDESIGQNPSLHHLKFLTAKPDSATYRNYSILTNRSQVTVNPRVADIANLYYYKHMSIVHTSSTLKTIFLQDCIRSVFIKSHSWKDLLAYYL